MGDYAMIVTAPGGPEGFALREIKGIDPGPGEVRLRQTAVGLNFIDVYHRSGLYPWPVERDLVVGSEGAGVVEAVGPGVTGIAPGMRVAYTHPLGAYASVRLLPADRLVPIPEGVEDTVAASLMLKGLTAQYLLHSTYPVAAGQRVLVHAAAGGVGLLLGQWLRAKGAVAIGTAGGPEKAALAREAGYAHVIDYRDGDFVARLREIAPEGVDVVYDGVGADTWRGSLEALKVHGTYVCFGQASGPLEGFGMPSLAGRSLHACRPVLFHYISDAAALRARAQALFDAVRDGTLTAQVRQRFDLREAARAHRALESRATTGATVLVP